MTMGEIAWWIWCALLWPFAPCESAEDVAARQGAKCERGCIGGSDGWVYEVTRDDLVWFARMANCEIRDYIGTDDADATLWAVVQGFYRAHLVGRNTTLASYASTYSGCTSRLWATGGRYYSPRITPIADVNRKTRWRDLPQRVRDVVRSFFRGEIRNRWPGWCWVWTHGWEHHADSRLIGPFYAVEDHGQSFNAYYQDAITEHWMPWQVQIVAPPAEEE